MTTSNDVCYYGRHIGCPYGDDPTCRGCAERLTMVVERERHRAGSVIDDGVSGRGPGFNGRREACESWRVLTNVQRICAALYTLLLLWR